MRVSSANGVSGVLEEPRRIMVVDDDLDFAESLEAMLEALDFQVAIAHTADQAREVCAQFSPAVALLDVRFGNMSGVDLIPLLREIEPDLLCVMVTGHADVSTAVEAVRKGAYDYLNKPLNNENLLRLLNHCFDTVHARKEKEHANKMLATSEQRLQITLDTMPISVAIFARDDGKILYVNRHLEQTLDWHSEQLIGKSLFEAFKTFQPESEFQDLIAKSGAIMGAEADFSTRQGTPLSILYSARPMEYQGESVVLVSLVDITVQKNAERKIEEYSNQLEVLVKQRTQQLSQTNRSLQESLEKLGRTNQELEIAMQSKSRFLAHMSHELRTPLNAILGYSDLLLGQQFGKLNDKQFGYSEKIEQSGNHLLNLINDMLNFTRLDAKDSGFRISSVDVYLCLQEIMEKLNNQISEKQLEVSIIPAEQGQFFPTDKINFNQILFNLISNAVKFTRGKGQVRVSTVVNSAGNLRLEVCDNGDGIPLDQQEKIFDEFYQMSKHQEQVLGGAGIGLSLTKKIVALQKGKIGVVSKEGEGSTFWVELPSLKQGHPSGLA